MLETKERIKAMCKFESLNGEEWIQKEARREKKISVKRSEKSSVNYDNSFF